MCSKSTATTWTMRARTVDRPRAASRTLRSTTLCTTGCRGKRSFTSTCLTLWAPVVIRLQTRRLLVALPLHDDKVCSCRIYPNKKELYDEYARDMLARLAAPVPIGEQPPLPPCTINYFRQVWRTEFKNLHLRKHLRFSRCDVCVELRERFGRIENHCPIKHKATQAEFRAHINHVKAERTYYHKKREEAAKANSDTLSIIFDGADQGSYGEWLAAAAQLQRSQRILRDRIIAHLLALHVCVQASRTSTSDRSARRAWRRRSII